MKFSQIAAIVATLAVSIVVVMWLASTVPAVVFEDTLPPAENADEAKPTPAESNGVVSSNPFDLTTEGPHPKAVLVEEVFNFGTMALGEVGTHAFIVKNEGDVPLKLAKGPTQCKCTLSELAMDSIPPGEEASIELQYEPKGLGEFGQGASIWTNDPDNSELRIRVEGKMVPGFQIIPNNGWSLGSIPDAEPVELEGGIYSSIEESFDIVSIETSSDAVTIEAVPLTEEQRAEVDALSGYRLIGAYQPPEEAGEVQEEVTIKTSLQKNSVIKLQISGSRSGPIAIIGPGWAAGAQRLNLGRVNAEKGHSQRLTFMIEPIETEIQITEIEATPSFLNATVKAEKNAPDAARHRFTFNVEVPQNAPKGIWNSGNPGQIKIKTNHPKLEEIGFSVHMIVQ